MSKGEVPHVWHTVDSEGGDVRHLAMGWFGAQQAHMLHHGMMGLDGKMTATDEGPVGDWDVEYKERGKKELCLEPYCVLYGLRFPSDEED